MPEAEPRALADPEAGELGAGDAPAPEVPDGRDSSAPGAAVTTASPSLWGFAGRLALAALAGAVIGAIGTTVHRAGITGPFSYGIVLALALVTASALAARSFSGRLGAFVFAVGWAVAVQTLALAGPGGDVMVVGGSASGALDWSVIVGYVWIFGGLVIALAVALLPARWFLVEPR